jgi:hypothetical protein
MMSKLAHPQGTNAVNITSHLLSCYGSFADKRIKKPSESRRFIVDSGTKTAALLRMVTTMDGSAEYGLTLNQNMK